MFSTCYSCCEASYERQMISRYINQPYIDQYEFTAFNNSKLRTFKFTEQLRQIHAVQLFECKNVQFKRAPANITTLVVKNCGLKQIDGIGSMTQLQILDLSNNGLQNISRLSSMVNLRTLNVGCNKISNIAPLKLLFNLEVLYLYGNNINNIYPLQNLTNLTSLELGDNKLIDISPLSSLVNLTQLFLYKNFIVHISPVKNLMNLSTWNVAQNYICDLGPIKNQQRPTKEQITFASRLELIYRNGQIYQHARQMWKRVMRFKRQINETKQIMIENQARFSSKIAHLVQMQEYCQTQ
ncbi:leucine-rich_repeat domain-containing protein [Hexamita inflata]|uniref:Leucine-rich repeat domain-containing protein n=1 Tax=Hexamita inflata TaxID=28002 RepID=A0AA86R873_9EUKA|nr:leucine-rich repeat domain-containing protein [Hexamita inflata]